MNETLKEKINSFKNKQKKIAKKAALTTAVAAGMIFTTDKLSAHLEKDATSTTYKDKEENILSNLPQDQNIFYVVNAEHIDKNFNPSKNGWELPELLPVFAEKANGEPFAVFTSRPEIVTDEITLKDSVLHHVYKDINGNIARKAEVHADIEKFNNIAYPKYDMVRHDEYFYNDKNELIREVTGIYNTAGTSFSTEKVYDSEMLKTSYPITKLKKYNGKLATMTNMDTDGKVVRSMAYDNHERISEISFGNDQKAVFGYDKDTETLKNIDYYNGSEHKSIKLKQPVKNSIENSAVQAYARLAKTDLSSITPDNIDKKVVENYIATGDVPREDAHFDKLYKAASQNNQIINARQNTGR